MMTLQTLVAPQQALLTLAEAVSHMGEIGANSGFERCQVEAVPATPDASAVAALLHRGTAQVFGPFQQFPIRMRMRVQNQQDAETAIAMTGSVRLLNSTHVAIYQPTSSSADEFILTSAGIFVAPPLDDELIMRNLNLRTTELNLTDMDSHRAKRGLSSLSLDFRFVWQLVTAYEDERSFRQSRGVSFTQRERPCVVAALQRLGLSFGMKLPEGFVGKTA